MPAGRPKSLAIDAELLEKVEALAAQGLTMDQIAHCLGIHGSTLYKNKAENTEFSEAIKRGRSKGIATITNALFVKAKNGDTTAQIFYLKNRDSDNWLDTKHVKSEVDYVARLPVVAESVEEWQQRYQPPTVQ
jgi:cytidylate kinase